MNTEKIMIVDDDENILTGFRRRLRRKYKIITSPNPVNALLQVKNQGPIAVVVSDMHMPKIDGVNFLTRLKMISPDSVRMFLTGDSDIETALDAVNQGQVFRYLLKPCPAEAMEKALDAGLEQYRLIMNERNLFEKTLKSCVQVIVDLLSMLNPIAFSRSRRIHSYVSQIVGVLKLKNAWEYEVAALLSQIGCVSVPEDTMRKYVENQPLSKDETKMIDNHPDIGFSLVGNIPRMELPAKMIAAQGKPCKNVRLEDVRDVDPAALGGLILKVVIDFDILVAQGKTQSEAADQLAAKPKVYEHSLVNLLYGIDLSAIQNVMKLTKISKLRDGMILAEDVLTRDGKIVVAKETMVNDAIRQTLTNFSEQGKIGKFCKVVVLF